MPDTFSVSAANAGVISKKERHKMETQMNLEELTNKVDMAIDMFFARDSKLFDIKASEWAVAHRIAVNLENYFEGWNIDCEYNKVGMRGTTSTMQREPISVRT